MLYMESYNSIFCKCIKDKPTNTKSVADTGFFPVAVATFFVEISYGGGGEGGGVVDRKITLSF